MFQPDVPVFDCNAALGRRHNIRVQYDRPEDLLRVMDEAGISRALVYNPYGMVFGTMEANRYLLEDVAGESRLVPQFVVSFATDELDEVAEAVRGAGVRSLRVFPKSHFYPLVHWIAAPWLEWMEEQGLSLWVPMGGNPEVDIRDLYDTAKRYPRVPVVLAASHYTNYAIVWPLLKVLDNIYFDVSRFDLVNGIGRLKSLIGLDRILFGSGFPEVDPEPYLYYLHHCGLKTAELKAICHDNLTKLLLEPPPR